jgi:hypothetical protein
MQANQNEDVFYGVYHSEKMSINLETVEPFYKALSRVSGLYIISRPQLKRFGGECGLVIERKRWDETAWGKYVIYVAEDLPHPERLVTIAHELIHVILVLQGFSFERQMLDEKSESWIDEIAKGFHRRNPSFLNWVYVQYARIAG